MSDETKELLHEERLQALVFKFLQLYDRLSEDRLVTAKQGADTAELVKLFTEQVKHFEALEPNVQKSLTASINNATLSVAKTIGDEVRTAATHSIEEVNQRLLTTVQRAEKIIAETTKRDANSAFWFGASFWYLLPIVTTAYSFFGFLCQNRRYR